MRIERNQTRLRMKNAATPENAVPLLGPAWYYSLIYHTAARPIDVLGPKWQETAPQGEY